MSNLEIHNGKKTGEVATAPSSADASTVLPLNPALRLPPEPEDPTLGKRKASQITADPQATPSVIQKRKKRRKVGPSQSISAANDSTTAEPPEPEVERGVVPGDVTRDAPSTSVGADTNQSVVPKKQTKTRKYPVASRSDSTPMDSAERRVEPPTEPAESSKAGKRGKTVVLDLSTVIPSPTAAQVRLWISQSAGTLTHGIGASIYINFPATLTCDQASTSRGQGY